MSLTNVLEPPSACRQPTAPRIPKEVEFRQEDEIRGPLLGIQFALPCAWERYQAGRFPEQDWRQHQAFAMTKDPLESEPVRAFLKKYFGALVSDIYTFGRRRGLKTEDQIWSYENVLGTLLGHKGHGGQTECDAKRVEIIWFDGIRLSPVVGHDCRVYSGFSGQSIQSPLFDFYGLDPGPGREVVAHKGVIVAPIPQ